MPSPSGGSGYISVNSAISIGQGFAGIAILALGLELASRTEMIASQFFPPLSHTFRVLFGLMSERMFWQALGDTMSGWVLGITIAIMLAVPIGLLIGSNEYVYRGLRPLIEFLRPIPSVALIPLAILTLGSGLASKVFLVSVASFWPILIQTMYGSHDRDPVHLETAASYRIGRRQRAMRVILPATLPYVGTGIRISCAVALVLAVTAELVIGSPGIGREIMIAQAGGDVPRMYAFIITTGILGVTVNMVISMMEARLLHWHPSHREAFH